MNYLTLMLLVHLINYQTLLDRKEIEINIDYEDYSQFINFSSAKTRLENFIYKVGLIQSSSAVLSASFGSS